MRTIARDNWTDSVGEHKNDIRVDASTKSFVLAEGRQAYAQTLEAVIKTVMGEIPVDIEKGVPYFDTIFNSSRALEGWADAVREEVGKLRFILEITSFDYGIERDARGKPYVAYELSVVTTDGSTVTVEV